MLCDVDLLSLSSTSSAPLPSAPPAYEENSTENCPLRADTGLRSRPVHARFANALHAAIRTPAPLPLSASASAADSACTGGNNANDSAFSINNNRANSWTRHMTTAARSWWMQAWMSVVFLALFVAHLTVRTQRVPVTVLPRALVHMLLDGGDVNLFPADSIDRNSVAALAEAQQVMDVCSRVLAAHPRICGLPAIALGCPLRAFCMWEDQYLKHDIFAILNPYIVFESDKAAAFEPELNVTESSIICPPNHAHPPRQRQRTPTVHVIGIDSSNNSRVWTFTDAEALCVQHLIDIVNGIYPCTQTEREQHRGLRPIVVLQWPAHPS